MEVPLTKSLYLAGRHCAKRLYLQVHRPDLAQPPSEVELERMRAGRRVEKLARDLFPEGRLIPSEQGERAAAVQATRQAVEEGAGTLFEATFLAEGLMARCDVLQRTPDGWLVTEVKSSTRVKSETIEDLAFQAHVLGLSGLSVARAAVCRVDSSNAFEPPEWTPDRLLATDDVTDQVKEAQASVVDWAKRFLHVLSGSAPPDEPTNVHCAGCAFHAHCHLDQPEQDVVFLPGVRRDAVVQFRESGARLIPQLTTNVKLTQAQRRAVQAVSSGEPYLGDGLAEALEGVRFPAHFVDFEACGAVMPWIPGVRPYQALPFQWSSHVLSAPDRVESHDEFLHRGPDDPRPGFVASLLKHLRGAESVVYYSSYETTMSRVLEAQGVPGADELLAIFQERGFDLLPIVREHVYFPAFKGSFSIKAVLPAVVPDLDYSDLDIKDGDSAALEYRRMATGQLTDEQAADSAAKLLKYCERDTWAMVRVYQELRKLACPAEPALQGQGTLLL